jgi:phosphonate transport system ATP-binding protein
MLYIEQVHKQYGDVYAVNGVSLTIPQGQMVGIIGRSGAGKTTLLRLINRLTDLTQGRIVYGDLEIGALKGRALRAWRARCAMIFQQFHLVPRLDVITNVLIGRLTCTGTLLSLVKYFPPADRATAIRALERLDMASLALQRADTLSGGQQQRVAIARALVQEPHILLADEPIASLDLHNATRVMEALRTINREEQLTVICNLHHVDTARHYCDRILGLTQGQITFDGPPDALTLAHLRDIYGVVDGDEELAQALAQARSAIPREWSAVSARVTDTAPQTPSTTAQHGRCVNISPQRRSL